jgi:diaminopimelate decarboxylase
MPAVPAFPAIRTEIAGTSIFELARTFGTPTYVYDAAKIVERINDLRAFDVIRFAQKACSNIAILDLCRRYGVLVDAVSAGEVGRALAAGYSTTGDPPPIVYTADIFDREALELVIAKNIHVNCGSPDMIDQLGAKAPGRHITLRLNPGFGHGHARAACRLLAASGPSRPWHLWHSHAHWLWDRSGAFGRGLRSP